MDRQGECASGRISACIVMYGKPEETLACVENICGRENGAGFVLFLVDNASPDAAGERIQAMGLPKNVVFLPLSRNKGFGGGHNSVLPRLASRYHAVINPDIALDGDTLAQMADWMDAHPDVVITAPQLIFPDGRPQPLAKRRPAFLPLLARQTGWKFLRRYEAHYLMEGEDLSNPTDVEFCSGSFFLIRTEAFLAIGGFDEGYFMYVEDADITQKALQMGRAVYLPQFTVRHEWQREAHGNLKKFFWQARSMCRYFRKWGFRWKS